MEEHNEPSDPIPIIFVTAVSQEEKQALERYRTGTADHLFRPLDPAKLRTELQAFSPLEMEKRELEAEVQWRKQLEKALRKTEEKLQNLFESMASGVAVYEAVENGEDFIFKEFNKASERIEHIQREDVIGKSVLEVFPGLKEFGLFEVFQRVLKTGKPERHPVSFYRDERVSGWRENYVFKLSSGEIVAIYEDVTEQKLIEESLKESEEKFRTICDSAQDAIIMIDNDTRISFWNDASEKIFGWSSDEVIGKDLHNLLSPEKYLAAFQKAREPFRKTGKGAAIGKTLELSALRKGGEEFPIELSLASVKTKDGWQAIGIVRDITERKRIENELRRAKEEAESAARAKSEFLANMSHEIRTPMNGVIGMTGLLLETDLTPEQREYTEIVRSSGEALLAVINDILDFSKIEAGKLDLEIIDFDLRTTLEQLGDVLAIKAHEKGLEYACVMDPEFPSLLQGDPGRLRQILTNLIGNAIKFTAKGEVRLCVRLEEEDDTQATIRFVVSDTGIGIPQDRIESLFDAFVQADASTTRKYGGTGLGLAISKQLVEMMGGQIGARSKEGKGATFWFTAVFEKQPVEKKIAYEIPVDIRNKRILVVDDNETNRIVLARQMESWHCRHDEAPDAETALRKLRAAVKEEDPFHVAILDMQMPEMDGETLGLKIKEDPLIQDTLLIMMTSVGKRGDAARFARVGFSAYFTKPVKQSELYNCLVTVLSEKPSSKQSRKRPIVTRHTLAENKKHNIRILLVEDNTTNRLVALKILEKLGYYADAVANGLEAVKALENLSYDLVLMDVQMPEMDGYEATKRIRDESSSVLNHNIPVIAMTAHAMKGDREKCLESGMDDYVSKPIQPKQLLQVIERWLGRVASRPSHTAPASASSPKNIFDRSRFLDRLDGDEELLKRIVGMFVEDASSQIKALKEALERQDTAQVQFIAHALKGSSSNINAETLQDVAQRMETMAKAGALDGADTLFEQIQAEYERLKNTLRNFGLLSANKESN